ncbi:MAG: efflux transporter periplasmic adaptor subunit [Verrucomicrobia bacterium]|nr:MAG: efflux transporter periplasmic adaptor subunit [Verrucomicrobiota bacterium]
MPKAAEQGAHTNTEATVELTAGQLSAIKIEPVGTISFAVEKDEMGNIDYDQDLAVQVFSAYPGKVINALASLGDTVQKGQPLCAIDSPDLIQAESALISATSTLELTTKHLARVRDLHGTNGVSEREFEQVTSDQHTAEGAVRAARNTLTLFGKSEDEIDRVVSTRQVDRELIIRSPVTGRVTARNAQPGLLVQPGTAPAPYAVADLSLKWLIANVPEADAPLFKAGQQVRATVSAFPGRTFEGKITRLAQAVDPTTHRLMLRSEIADPKDELRPGMLATFTIRVSEPVESAAIPMTGVVRNGDGTMAAWVTTDRKHFAQRIVKVGLQDSNRYQVNDGLKPNELAVTDGAIFLSNMLQAPPSD